MADKDEIITEIDNIFSDDFAVTDGTVIPEVDDIGLGNEGNEIELAMLFIDINESTNIVDGIRRTTAAKMYKSFLYGIAKIAGMNEGELRSFNGDGVLVVFSGDLKCAHAAKAALQMNWFTEQVLKPKIQDYLDSNKSTYRIDFSCGVGIDVGTVLVIRGGIRGENNNDLVWVGNATNYAVKLSKVTGKTIFISKDVYENLDATSKYKDPASQQEDMWTKYTWTEMNGEEIYGSSWTWSP